MNIGLSTKLLGYKKVFYNKICRAYSDILAFSNVKDYGLSEYHIGIIVSPADFIIKHLFIAEQLST